MKKRSEWIRICPSCGSVNVKSILLLSPNEREKYNVATRISGRPGEGMDYYVCKDCDYYGLAPEIKKDQVEEFKQNLKKLPAKKETPKQIAYVKLYHKYGPLALFVMVFVMIYDILVMILDNSGVKVTGTLYDAIIWGIIFLFSLVIAIMYIIELVKASKTESY
jgi:hypothetical protein